MAEETAGAIIGRNVRHLRDAGLWTRSELAEKSGVSRQAIAHMELGISDRPRRGTIEKLAKGLGVDVETLLAGVYEAEGGHADPLGAAAPPSPEPEPGVPAHMLQSLRRWMTWLEPRLEAHNLTYDQLRHEIDALVAIGSKPLPATDDERLWKLATAMRDELKTEGNIDALEASLRDRSARHRAVEDAPAK
jgi:transcriptional regulator with XRE-family HTH domain